MPLKVTLGDAEHITRGYGKLRLLSSREARLRNLQVLHMIIDPGQKTSKHHHPSEEVFYLLRGRAKFLGADMSIEVEEGEVVVVGPGEPHQIENPSNSQECVILVALSPPRQPGEVIYCE